MALRTAEAVYDARMTVSDFFGGTRAENVVFTMNATHALNLAINGCVKKGDHILISNLEHNSVLRPVAEIARRGISEYDVFDALCDDDTLIRNIENAIHHNTRLLIATHVSNICGRRLPIERIYSLCRRYGIICIVDISQSAGVYDIDIEKCADILCAPGHKGLYGMQGSGFSLFRDDFDFEKFSPLLFGGNGINSRMSDMGSTPPESFEAGTVAVPNIMALREGIRFVKRRGEANIRRHEQKICERIRAYLSSRPDVTLYSGDESAGIILFNIAGMSGSSLAAKLSEKCVCTRAGLHCAPLAHDALGTGGDAVRLSFSAFTRAVEAEDFCRIMNGIV